MPEPENTQIYHTLLTTQGAAEWASAQAQGRLVSLTHIVVGDGAGSAITPLETMTALVREVHPAEINSVAVDSENAGWLVIEAVIPSWIGGWTIREIGLIGGEGGQLLAVGNFPDSYKPKLAEGAAKDLAIRMIIEVSNAEIVNLSVDPSVVLATKKMVSEMLAVIQSAHAENHLETLRALNTTNRLMLAAGYLNNK